MLVSGAPGAASSPRRVDPHHDLVRHVGGDALELASTAPTVVCSDALAGARALAAEGCDLMIIADGRMGEQLRADRRVVVADARRGQGNRFVVPAGPVRAPVTAMLREAHVMVRLNEGDAADRLVRLASRAARPVVEARTRLPAGSVPMRPVMALAAVRDNEGFFDSLRRAGAEIAVAKGFPDGHLYAPDELADLESVAAAGDLAVLTTRRDLNMLRQAGPAAEPLLARTRALAPEVTFDPAGALEALVRDAVADWRARLSV